MHADHPGAVPDHRLRRRTVLAGFVAGGAFAAGATWPVDSSHRGQAVERQSAPSVQPDDDTQTLNDMLARGGEVVVPAREYSVTADETGRCLVAEVPGTVVRFEPGTVIRLRPNRLGGYIVLAVSAAECQVSGGTIVGDVRNHEGEDGEWGHGLAMMAGADRCLVEGVRATECWGDGFYVSGAVVDVRLHDCVAVDNRRQGLSVVDAVRLRIRGGSYGGTGRLRQTTPASGIDLEPNPRGAVVEAVLDRVNLQGNHGHGLLVSARHGPVSAAVTGCTASGNRDAGYLFDGPGTKVLLRDSTATANARGVVVSQESTGVAALNVSVSASQGPGFVLGGMANALTACTASGNGASGFVVPSTAQRGVLTACQGIGNSRTSVVPDFDIGGPGTVVRSPRSVATAGNPSSAVVVRPSAVGTAVLDAAWTGTYAVKAYQDLRPLV